MKNFDLSNAKLLKVLACKENKTSHNKNIKFYWEEEGTLLYYKKVDEGWLFSTRKSSNPTVPVRKGKSTGYFTYINIRNIISHEGYVAVYLVKKGVYLVKPATSEQEEALSIKPQKRIEGDVIYTSESYYIHLNKNRHQYIYGKNKCAKVRIVNDGLNAYMEVEPASKEDIRKYPTLINVQTPFGNWKTLGLVKEYTYIQPKSSDKTLCHQDILCPISFMRVNNREKEPFMVWQRDNGAVILEPHPLKCDICGGKISRFKDKSIKGYTCNSCHKILPKIRQLVTNEDFNSTLNSIRSVQSLLESMK